MKDELRVDRDALRPVLTTSEIEKAMRRLGRKEAEGCDGISAEFQYAFRKKPLNQLISCVGKFMKREYGHQISKTVY